MRGVTLRKGASFLQNQTIFPDFDEFLIRKNDFAKGDREFLGGLAPTPSAPQHPPMALPLVQVFSNEELG